MSYNSNIQFSLQKGKNKPSMLLVKNYRNTTFLEEKLFDEDVSDFLRQNSLRNFEEENMFLDGSLT